MVCIQQDLVTQTALFPGPPTQTIELDTQSRELEESVFLRNHHGKLSAHLFPFPFIFIFSPPPLTHIYTEREGERLQQLRVLPAYIFQDPREFPSGLHQALTTPSLKQVSPLLSTTTCPAILVAHSFCLYTTHTLL